MFNRRTAPRLLLPALLAALTLTAPATADPAAVRWRTWDDGLREASKSSRPVLVDVYTDWCGWCRRMDRDVYARADIREYLAQRFVTVKLNAESSANGQYEGRARTSRALAQRFRVTGYPTSVFLRADGDHIVNVNGYVPADRFLLILRYIGDGHLDRGTPFEEFERQSGASGRR